MINLSDLVLKVAQPLLKGNIAKHPEKLKQLQNFIQLMGGALPLIAVFVPGAQFLIDKDVLVKTYSAIGAVSIYLNTASSDKIGL